MLLLAGGKERKRRIVEWAAIKGPFPWRPQNEVWWLWSTNTVASLVYCNDWILPFSFSQAREHNAWQETNRIKEAGSSDDLWITFGVVLPLSWRIAHLHSWVALWSSPVGSKKSYSHLLQFKLAEFLLRWLIRSMVLTNVLSNGCSTTLFVLSAHTENFRNL